MPYQSQDIPPLSRLYHLAPVGVGTPNVESLTSFVMRLAAAHCVKTGTVIAQEIAPLINESETKPALRSINGVGPAAPNWVSALESLTRRRNLHLLTMLPWRHIMPLRNSMRLWRAWCPDCFAVDRREQESVFERLAWALDSVSVCILHNR